MPISLYRNKDINYGEIDQNLHTVIIYIPKIRIFSVINMLQPGKALKQRPQYIIEKVIGEGGFGITYKARHQELNFPVVIKTPNSRLCRDANYPKYVEGFRKEGRTLAKISQNHHPNIVRIIDFFEEGDLPCLVMDFVKGENLYHLIQNQ